MKSTPQFRRIDASRALFAAVVLAAGAVALHKRGYDLLLVGVIAVLIGGLGLARRFAPAYFELATGWIYGKPLPPGTDHRDQILWQLNQLTFVVGAASTTLALGDFPAFIVIGIFLVGSMASLMFTHLLLNQTRPNPFAMDRVPVSFVNQLRMQVARKSGRVFVGAGPEIAYDVPGMRISVRRVRLVDAMMELHLHLGASITVHGISDPYLHAVADLLCVSPSFLIEEQVDAGSFKEGDMLILVESPIFMDDHNPAKVTAELLAARGVEVTIVEIVRVPQLAPA